MDGSQDEWRRSPLARFGARHKSERDHAQVNRGASRPRRLQWGGALLLLFAILPANAWPQCAVCGNPAFAVGDNDLRRIFLPGAPSGVRVSTALLYASQRYSDIYEGSRRLSGSEKAAIMFTPDWLLQTHVVSLVMGVEFSSGTQLQVLAPYAVANATRLADSDDGDAVDSVGNAIDTKADQGLSDVEFRLRQRLRPLLKARAWPLGLRDIIFSVGAVAPSGGFIAKDPNGAEPTGYASLGRGVWWLSADLEAFGAVGARFGWMIGASARLPQTTITNAGSLFRWGREVRSHGALTALVVPKRLSFSFGAEWLWRGKGEERLFEGLPIDVFPNGGGRWLTLVPSIQVQLPGRLALHAAVRVPMWRAVGGLQPTQGPGWTLGLSGAMGAI